jgi:anaerobic sulfite reductase subunit B
MSAPPDARVADPLSPVPCRVLEREVETADVVTFLLEAPDPPLSWRPGQFNMLSAFGVGEVAISVAGAPTERGPIRHTVRDVGAVTHALCAAPVGSFIGVRGAYGAGWGIEDVGDRDVVVVAGGIGLAPLRGAIEMLVGRSVAGSGRVFVAVGAREPGQVIFGEDLLAWRAAGAAVEVTVDVAGAGWSGHVGLVTALLPLLDFDPSGTVAMVCGPEVMMRFVARDLVARGVDPGSVRISLERNMQCGVALCGHCQLGPLLLCRDGPVVAYGDVAELMNERER